MSRRRHRKRRAVRRRRGNTRKATVRVLVVPVGRPPEVHEIPNTLEAAQSIVGGYIEAVSVGDDSGVMGLCNENGRSMGLPRNRIVLGDFFVARVDPRTGDQVDLTPDDISIYSALFADPRGPPARVNPASRRHASARPVYVCHRCIGAGADYLRALDRPGVEVSADDARRICMRRGDALFSHSCDTEQAPGPQGCECACRRYDSGLRANPRSYLEPYVCRPCRLAVQRTYWSSLPAADTPAEAERAVVHAAMQDGDAASRHECGAPRDCMCGCRADEAQRTGFGIAAGSGRIETRAWRGDPLASAPPKRRAVD